MGCIYRLTFASGKSYIGLTTFTIERRLEMHRNRLKQGKRNELLYNAWRKHGEPIAFVIAELPNDQLAQAEIEAIARFITLHPNGYNVTSGGEISPALFPWVREKISMSQKGRPGIKPTAEMNAKRSASLKADWAGWSDAEKKTRGMNGKTHSEEAKKKIGMGNRGKQRSDELRLQISKSQLGRKASESTKARMREAQLERWRAAGEEGRRLQGDRRRGIPLTLETRMKMSQAQKGHIVTDEARKNMAESQRRRSPFSEATRAKLSEAQRRVWLERRAN